MFSNKIETFRVLPRVLFSRQICFSSKALFGGRKRKKGKVQEKSFPFLLRTFSPNPSFTCAHFSLTGEKILEHPLTNPDFRSTMHSQFHIPPNVLNQKSKVPTLCPESCRMVRGSHRPDLKIPEEQPAERMRVSPDAWQALQCRTFN